MRPKDLQLGALSTRAQRRVFLLLLLLTVLPRLHVWLRAPLPASQSSPTLADFLSSPQWPWTGAPLVLLLHALDNSFFAGEVFAPLVAVVSAAVVLLLVRAGRRWLDLPTGIVAAVLWGCTALAIAPPMAAAPALLAGAASLFYARQLLRFAARRRADGAWRLGLTLGVIGWLSGLAWLWLLGTLLWLPVLSRHFRGLAWLRMTGLVLAGTLLLLLPIGLRNLAVDGDFRLPTARAPAQVLAGAHAPTVGQPFAEGAATYASPELGRWVQRQLEEASLKGETSSFAEGAALTTLLLHRWGEEPLSVLRTAVRRVIAFLAGWPGTERMDLAGLPAVPWAVAGLLAWLGLAALLPSARVFFPLFLGVLLPTLQAAAYGVDAGTILLVLPFYCLFAGYGLVRLAQGRRWLSTWAVGLVLLAVAVVVHRWVAGWA